MRHFHFALLSVVLFVAAQPLVAATYYVGNCKIGAYSTIQAAVNAVPADSTIGVCPGTYAEQVVISKALSLRGATYQNSSKVVIAMPSAGLATTSSGTVAAQVEVTAGPVSLIGITVDGTANTTNCPSGAPQGFAAIFYSSGSSGTVSEVETRNQTCNGYGFGILAENGPLTIGNSNIHDNTFGISASGSTSIKGNYVASSGGALPSPWPATPIAYRTTALTAAVAVMGSMFSGGPLSPATP